MNQTFENDERIDDLIVDYLSHQCTVGDERELQAWLALSEGNRRYFIEIQDIWNSSGIDDKSFFNKDAAYRRFKERIVWAQRAEKRQNYHHISILLRVAVAVLVFVTGSLSYYAINSYLIQHNTKQYAIYVPYGAKTRVVLPDHSVVWLNAGSTLQYGQNFGQKSRQVALVGEGYFEIAHNPAMPFTVKANEASIRDLGTKFDVKAYPEDSHLSVTLLRGSIQLTTIYHPEHPLLLKPNELAVIDKRNKGIEIKRVDASEAAAWTEGKIVFDEEYFGQIIRRLERDYNVVIDIRDPQLYHLRFYGDFSQAQSIQEILNVMTANKEFHYTMAQNHITIYQ
ncbi:FecR family protein [Microbacter margulisiae]|uniref:Ferric-dicitrate binding protein FerR (Iron transport regulator) n=1 Tax=Microbacter margulisiae TaxID=1350067 RepID=A0A7W5DTA2_9PORP|nr:FecR domain-containing protein [Microbacter margulisiae]MBB3188662.1 ferric-dicitrate binding protein FerR (iron transport regulator) [Microbacter margulisiae]